MVHVSRITWQDPVKVGEKLLCDQIRTDIEAENFAQLGRWGRQQFDPAAWSLILTEELSELLQDISNAHFAGSVSPNLRREAIQLATVAIKIARMATPCD
jgi:hypothetical protein